MRQALIGAVATSVMGLGLVTAAAPAQAADFCGSRVGTASYYQHDFRSGGAVVATICAPSGAGNVYLYARGQYANISKYMKISVSTNGSAPVSADGTFYEYVYRARPAGNHDYHAVMYDGHGTEIVDAGAYDYE